MREVGYLEIMGELVDKMSHAGVFLNVGGEKPNTMTIGWGWIGYCWKRPTFVTVVRPQRFTHDALLREGEFTVSVPTSAPLTRELAFAGSTSGRDTDKFDGHGLTAAPAQKVGAPIIAECGLHLECKTRLVQEMTPDRMDADVAGRMYPANDFHTMIVGEIVACYRTDE